MANELGLIGLGRIGGGLALQAIEKGIRVVENSKGGLTRDLVDAGVEEFVTLADLRHAPLAAALRATVHSCRAFRGRMPSLRRRPLADLPGGDRHGGDGLLAESSLGHDSPFYDDVHTYKIWMITASILMAISAAAAFLFRRSTSRLACGVVLALLLATNVVGALGADRGSYLVYGRAIGIDEQGLDAQRRARESPHTGSSDAARR